MTKKVAVIVLNWKLWEDTLVCLEAVQKTQDLNMHVVVVDNGSPNESGKKLQEWVETYGERNPRVSYELLLGKHNLGFSKGCNWVLDKLLPQNAYEYYLLLNNDAIVAPDAINLMVEAAEKAHADLIGAFVYNGDGSQVLFGGRAWPWHIFGFDKMKQDPKQEIWPTDQIDGSCFMMTHRFLQKRMQEVGFILDPSLFMYCEDSDLALYGKYRGYRSILASRAIVHHGLSKSSGGAGSPHSFYYITRNRIYLARLWLKPSMRLLFHLYYLPSRLTLLAVHLLRGRRKVARAVLRGIIDGYRGVKGPVVIS